MVMKDKGLEIFRHLILFNAVSRFKYTESNKTMEVEWKDSGGIQNRFIYCLIEY